MLRHLDLPCNPNQLSILDLAFVGDAVYGLLVREYLAKGGACPVGKLHARAVGLVCAKAQSAAVGKLLPLLTEQETVVFKRGRNANGVKAPKHTEQADYRRATGLEALFGWLYLSGENDRIYALFEMIIDFLNSGE